VADLSRSELQRLARLGAKSRLEELRQEEDAIRHAFPDLFGGRGRGKAVDRTPVKRRRRRRGKLSAAGRAAISAAQRKRWAVIKRQRAKGKAASQA